MNWLPNSCMKRGDAAVLPVDEGIGPVQREPAPARMDERFQCSLLGFCRAHIAGVTHERIGCGDRFDVRVVPGHAHPDAIVRMQQFQQLEPREVEVVEAPPDDQTDIHATSSRGHHF